MGGEWWGVLCVCEWVCRAWMRPCVRAVGVGWEESVRGLFSSFWKWWFITQRERLLAEQQRRLAEEREARLRRMEMRSTDVC